MTASEADREPGEFAQADAPHLPAAPSLGQVCQQCGTATANLHAIGPTFVPGIQPQFAPVKLSILMAAYNEEDTIGRAVHEVLRADYPCDIEFIVVDDGSTDRTPLVLAQLDDSRLQVLRHAVNRGKGAALLTAASVATGSYILPFDADLEYSPEDIPRMLEPVLNGRASVVYGARMFGLNTVYRSYHYAMGNRLLTHAANFLFNACISDLHTCLKLVPLEMLRGLELREAGFGLDTELTALILRKGVRPFEVPVSYYGRSHAQGKKITWRDAVVCAWILLRVRITGHARRPRRALKGVPAVAVWSARAAGAHPNGNGSADAYAVPEVTAESPATTAG